jgi:kynureninase
VRYLCETLGPRLGAEVVVVPSPDGDGLSADESRIREAIDGRTALVALSHVLFKSAFVFDVSSIAEKCRREGALLALDAYQSVGTMPVSVGALGVDVLLGGVLKWLCGGPGGAFLWVRPELRTRLEPSLTGWMAHPAPFDFEPPPMRWRDDAFRFLLGTPAVPALYAAREGPRLVRQAGLEAIRAKSIRQTQRLIDLAGRRGFRCAALPDPARRGGTVAVDFEHALEVSRELNARDVVVDYRPGAGIRMSPHFYTADGELDRAFEAIDEIRASGAWERWRDRGSFVT